WPGIAGQVRYSEGLDVGYRWYDDNNVDPAFPFGFGLSYTSFAFRNLRVHSADSSDALRTVQVDVTNTGTRAGADVVQLYVTRPLVSGTPTPRPSPGPSAFPSTVASDATTCWQDQIATLVNGGLSITGGSAPANPSQFPVG